MKHKQWNSTIGSVKKIAPLLILTLISACTSPLWWHDPTRGFFYRGWSVNVTDQATVMRECPEAAVAAIVRRRKKYCRHGHEIVEAQQVRRILRYLAGCALVVHYRFYVVTFMSENVGIVN